MPRDAPDTTAPEPALALWLVEQAVAHGTLVHVARSETRLARLQAAATVLAGPFVAVLALPPWDVLPYDRSAPSPRVVGERVRTLSALAQPADRPRLLLTTADALLQRVPPRQAWAGSELRLAVGDVPDLDLLRAGLAERGYRPDERIDEPSEAVLRGGTIEVFPAAADAPVRLMLDDEGRIAAIQAYDPASQRSTGALDEVVLGPAIEFPPDPDELEEAAAALANPDAEADPGDDAPVSARPTSTSAAPATCSARRRPGTSARSAPSSTSTCSPAPSPSFAASRPPRRRRSCGWGCWAASRRTTCRRPPFASRSMPAWPGSPTRRSWPSSRRSSPTGSARCRPRSPGCWRCSACAAGACAAASRC